MKRVKLYILAMVVLSFCKNAYAQSPTNGLVAQFDLHGNLEDSSGNGIIANLPSGTTWTTDQFGNPDGALDFGASGGVVTGTGINLANSSSSISLWLEKNYVGDGSNGSWILSVGQTTSQAGQAMHIALDYGESIRYSFFYDDMDVDSPTLLEGQWYNLTVTFDDVSNERDMYLDGSLIASDTADLGFSGNSNFTFGNLDVSMDDISFYNRVLSPEEVEEIYNEPNPVPEPSFYTLAAIGFFVMKRWIVKAKP